MSNYILPPISSITSLDTQAKVQLLTHLFEKCETLTSYLVPELFNQNHTSYVNLIEAARSLLLKLLEGSDFQRINRIIAAHPRLGPQKQQLSSHSSSEQKSLAASSPEETEKLVSLNEEYEAVFPGLRYVVFVNGRSRASIMENMRKRIDRGDVGLERREAFEAMCDIALDRAKKLGAKL
ncbi:unnamed protein product [Kuraishia capsulata CBS 1993]|uniref:Oxo-4-hydroxy-4-carboxy-5-ureidoimidazoline decarboxylase domain-containing protein n=1 Tax=Kuraishia capsulata CBS 1993 TaxID=1382522 RepID=W6MXV8_9ASCO|nr:uncharacterized protein KUCA_T00005552001 [Kuraishia capsulata CBS 1993]CDK29560.1 unnamed protein product [Kuraishia capsulata CBS 1993]